MVFKFLFLIVFPFVLFSGSENIFSENEDPSLFHHVNVISGHLNLHFEDVTSNGTLPISLFRSYSSSGALEKSTSNDDLIYEHLRKGWQIKNGWDFLPHIALVIYPNVKNKLIKAHIAEPNGRVISYKYSHKRDKNTIFLIPEGPITPSLTKISKRTNPRYNQLKLDLRTGRATLLLPNGGKRKYKGKPVKKFEYDKQPFRFTFYLLQDEKLSSKEHYLYHYDDETNLTRIESTNPDKDKIYAWIGFEKISRKDKPYSILAKTSDGKEIHYRSILDDRRRYLTSAASNARPHQKINYESSRSGTGLRVSSAEVEGSKLFHATYYGEENPNHIDKVRKITAPFGEDGKEINLASFIYYPNHTDVRDSEGLLTRYHHDSHKLISIEYFDADDNLYSSQKFYFKEGNIHSKVKFDREKRPLFAKSFAYKDGNLIKESVWGNLTGVITPLQVDDKGNPSGTDSYSRSFTYDKNDLLIRESEEEGPTFEYSYKPGTDLLLTKLTKDPKGDLFKRESFSYDEDNLLIEEIVEDGFCTFIKNFRRKRNDGCICIISESYLDPETGDEELLKKVLLQYKNGLVWNEKIFDANNTFCYRTQTEYNSFGQVSKKITPLGKTNTYIYNKLGLLESSKEVGSFEKLYQYDKANRQTICLEPETNKSIETTYDPKGRVLSLTDERGNSTTHTYDSFGNRIKTTLPKSGGHFPTFHFKYDINNNLIYTRAPAGEETHTSYNIFQNPTEIIQADGTKVLYVYNKNGTLARTIQPDGSYIDYDYDFLHRVIAKKIVGSRNRVLSREKWIYEGSFLKKYINSVGLETIYTYDGAGRKIREEAEGRTISYSYNALGFLESTSTGASTHYTRHNKEGEVVEEWDEDGVHDPENHMQFFYDEENRKVKAVRITSEGPATDHFHYQKGRLIKHIDPNGAETSFDYNEEYENEFGEKVLQRVSTDPIQNQTIETHDVGGRIVKREKRAPLGNTTSKEEFFYDLSGNRIGWISHVFSDTHKIQEKSIHWHFDEMGRVTEQIEGDEKITSYSYGKMGRITTKTLPSETKLFYEYDSLGRMLSQCSSDNTINYMYFYQRGPDPTQIIDYIHDISLDREYNLFGELIFETNPHCRLSWEYDTQGRCTSFTLPDQSQVSYTYSGSHMTAVSRITSQGDTHYQHQYLEFDPNGHVAKESLILDLSEITSSRDLLERPSTQSSSYLDQSISYGLSGLVMKKENSLLGPKKYTYDFLNQLTSEDENQYHFDSLGNPTEFQINHLNQITETPTCSLTYDLDGNPLERSSPSASTQYSYDALGRLIEITKEDSTAHYYYDAFSRLFAKEKNGEKSYYLYDQDKEIGRFDESNNLIEFKTLGLGIQGDIGAAIAIELHGEIFAPLHDFGGNIVALIDSTGEIAETYNLDAFGKEPSSHYINPWRFSSKRHESDLIFFGLRFYDPSLCRWLTPDPSGFSDGANLYLFVQNNPQNRLDLFGLFSADLFSDENRLVDLQINVDIASIPRIHQIATLRASAILNGQHIDCIVSCGHWHLLQFTQEEKKSGVVNILNHFHELTPESGSYIGLLTLGNGINVGTEEHMKMCDSLSQKIGGTLLISLHNSTNVDRFSHPFFVILAGMSSKLFGLGADILRTQQERAGVSTKMVQQSSQIYAFLAQQINKINPECALLSVFHSEGGVIGRRSYEIMSAGEKEITRRNRHILALGPAMAIPMDQEASVVNIYSEKDYVTGFGPFGYAKHFMNDLNYDIRVATCISPIKDRNLLIADHGYLKPTYSNAEDDFIKDLNRSIPFYRGNKYVEIR